MARNAADWDAADIQNLRLYYTEGKTFLRSSELTEPRGFKSELVLYMASHYTRGYTVDL